MQHQDLDAFVQRIQDYLESNKFQKCAVVFLGSTGAGKTLTIDFVLGANIVQLQNTNRYDKRIRLDVSEHQQADFGKVGHETDSETKQIVFYVLNEDLLLGDFPGTCDTNPIDEIINCVLRSKAMQQVLSIKPVFVVSLDDFSNARAPKMIDTVDYISKCFTDPSYFKHISILITHAKADDSDLDAVGQLQYEFGRLSESAEVQNRGCKQFCDHITTALDDVVKRLESGDTKGQNESNEIRKEKSGDADNDCCVIVARPLHPQTRASLISFLQSCPCIEDPGSAFQHSLSESASNLLYRIVDHEHNKIVSQFQDGEFEPLSKQLSILDQVGELVNSPAFDVGKLFKWVVGENNRIFREITGQISRILLGDEVDETVLRNLEQNLLMFGKMQILFRSCPHFKDWITVPVLSYNYHTAAIDSVQRVCCCGEWRALDARVRRVHLLDGILSCCETATCAAAPDSENAVKSLLHEVFQKVKGARWTQYENLSQNLNALHEAQEHLTEGRALLATSLVEEAGAYHQYTFGKLVNDCIDQYKEISAGDESHELCESFRSKVGLVLRIGRDPALFHLLPKLQEHMAHFRQGLPLAVPEDLQSIQAMQSFKLLKCLEESIENSGELVLYDEELMGRIQTSKQELRRHVVVAARQNIAELKQAWRAFRQSGNYSVTQSGFFGDFDNSNPALKSVMDGVQAVAELIQIEVSSVPLSMLTKFFKEEYSPDLHVVAHRLSVLDVDDNYAKGAAAWLHLCKTAEDAACTRLTENGKADIQALLVACHRTCSKALEERISTIGTSPLPELTIEGGWLQANKKAMQLQILSNLQPSCENLCSTHLIKLKTACQKFLNDQIQSASDLSRMALDQLCKDTSDCIQFAEETLAELLDVLRSLQVPMFDPLPCLFEDGTCKTTTIVEMEKIWNSVIYRILDQLDLISIEQSSRGMQIITVIDKLLEWSTCIKPSGGSAHFDKLNHMRQGIISQYDTNKSAALQYLQLLSDGQHVSFETDEFLEKLNACQGKDKSSVLNEMARILRTTCLSRVKKYFHANKISLVSAASVGPENAFQTLHFLKRLQSSAVFEELKALPSATFVCNQVESSVADALSHLKIVSESVPALLLENEKMTDKLAEGLTILKGGEDFADFYTSAEADLDRFLKKLVETKDVSRMVEMYVSLDRISNRPIFSAINSKVDLVSVELRESILSIIKEYHDDIVNCLNRNECTSASEKLDILEKIFLISTPSCAFRPELKEQQDALRSRCISKSTNVDTEIQNYICNRDWERVKELIMTKCTPQNIDSISVAVQSYFDITIKEMREISVSNDKVRWNGVRDEIDMALVALRDGPILSLPRQEWLLKLVASLESDFKKAEAAFNRVHDIVRQYDMIAQVLDKGLSANLELLHKAQQDFFRDCASVSRSQFCMARRAGIVEKLRKFYCDYLGGFDLQLTNIDNNNRMMDLQNLKHILTQVSSVENTDPTAFEKLAALLEDSTLTMLKMEKLAENFLKAIRVKSKAVVNTLRSDRERDKLDFPMHLQTLLKISAAFKDFTVCHNAPDCIPNNSDGTRMGCCANLSGLTDSIVSDCFQEIVVALDDRVRMVETAATGSDVIAFDDVNKHLQVLKYARDCLVKQDHQLARSSEEKLETAFQLLTNGDLQQFSSRLDANLSNTDLIYDLLIQTRELGLKIPLILPRILEAIRGGLEKMSPEDVAILGTKLVANDIGIFIVDEQPALKRIKDATYKRRLPAAHLTPEYCVDHMTSGPLDGDDVDHDLLKRAILEFQSMLSGHVAAFIESDAPFGARKAKLLDEIKATDSPKTATDSPKTLVSLVCTLFALLKSGENFKAKGADDVGPVIPHTIQIACILRLLGLDKAGGGVLDMIWSFFRRSHAKSFRNHVMQILTGEGKSIVLGVVAAVLALRGCFVDCVCYSSYLSQRDFQYFKAVFDALNVLPQIKYCTFQGLCEMHIQGVRDSVLSLSTAGAERRAKIGLGCDKKLRVLLIDEVDVFFNRHFYGGALNAGVLLKSDKIEKLIRLIWSKRNDAVVSVDGTSELDDALNESSVYRDVISAAAVSLAANVKSFGFPPYEVEGGKIGYMINGTIDMCARYPWRTVFAYLHEKEANPDRITDVHLRENLGLEIPCGGYAYAAIPNRHYQVILGVTGTLTTLPKADLEVLRDKFKVKSMTVAPSVYGQTKLEFSDENPLHVIVEESEPLWHRQIREMASAAARAGRAVLICFRNDEQVATFQDESRAYQELSGAQVLRDAAMSSQMTEDDLRTIQGIVCGATLPGKITLMTRRYGRGVDFVCNSSTVNEAGGVMMIQTFFSSSESEAVQIQGRVVRQGNNGSYRLILCSPHLKSKFELDVTNDLPRQELRDRLKAARERRHRAKCADRDARKAVADLQDSKSRAFVTALQEGRAEDAKKQLVNLRRVDQRAYIVILDASGSMRGFWPQLAESFNTFIALLRVNNQDAEGSRIKVIMFDNRAEVTTNCAVRQVPEMAAAMPAGFGHGTDFRAAFRQCEAELQEEARCKVPCNIIFMTDGEGGDPSEVVRGLLGAHAAWIRRFDCIPFNGAGQGVSAVLNAVVKLFRDSSVAARIIPADDVAELAAAFQICAVDDILYL